MAALAGWLALRRLRVLRSGGLAEGTVSTHQRREIDDSVGFHPTVCFDDHHGQQRQFTSNAGWSQPRPRAGTKVPVAYLRSDPNVAYIATFFHLWAAPLALALFSAVAAVSALLMR